MTAPDPRPDLAAIETILVEWLLRDRFGDDLEAVEEREPESVAAFRAQCARKAAPVIASLRAAGLLAVPAPASRPSAAAWHCQLSSSLGSG